MAFWLWTAIAAVLLAFSLAAMSRIRVRVRYSRSGELDQLIVIVRALYGLVHYRLNVPAILLSGWSVVYPQSSTSANPVRKSNKKAKRRVRFQTLRRYWAAYRIIMLSTRQFRRWLRHTLKKVECTRWRFDIRVGTGDAALTAATAGLCWTVLGCATAVTGHYLSLRTKPNGSVVPNFSRSEFSVVWEADFRIKAGTALAAGISLLFRTAKLRKSMKAWQSWLSGPERIS
ncbi:DUF2953 domain-containing protein [Cohnella faecalis]|nr:DUF2953 domain-containing protein [Cohnella faecalis]